MKSVDVVGAVILNDHAEILCALRGPAMTLPGYWEFPGGKIEPGEDPRACLQREITEELGCEIAVGRLVADHTHRYPEVIVRLRTYFARLTGGTPHPHEHERLVWLSVAELSGLSWAPADLPTLEALMSDQALLARAFEHDPHAE